MEQPEPSYLDEEQIRRGVIALKKYIRIGKAPSKYQRKNLLEAGEKDNIGFEKIIVEVVFKNIPTNSRTYIHNVTLPHHWRLDLDDYDLALFVPHRRPENEAQKIQFTRDRDLDVQNTHTYYEDLFREKLDEPLRSKISRIITTKELATEFNTFAKLDRLSKAYEFFLSDKQLMINKMNSLPRRLGRRFWVREKKVPVMVRLDAKNLNERFKKALSVEPFYVVGRTATERIQVGLMRQHRNDLVDNIQAFLQKLYTRYGNNVRFIRLRANWGVALPIYADLSPECPKVTMNKKRTKLKPVVDDFDLLPGNAKVSVHPDGTVKVKREQQVRKKIKTQ